MEAANWWLLVLIWHQQESPTWGAWRRKLSSAPNSLMVIRHGCENSMAMRQTRGQAPLQLGNSALLCSALLYSTLLYSTLLCTSPALSASSLGGKEKCTPQARGDLTYIDRSPHPWSWLVYPHANEDSKSLQFDWSKRHCLIGQNRSTLDWLELRLSDWMGKVLVLLVEIGFPELLYKGWLIW